MSGCGPILVPVDFSPDSVSALEWALGLAPEAGAVLVLHVAHDPSAAPGLYSDVQRQAPGVRIDEAAVKMTTEFAARMRDTHPDQPEFAAFETQVVAGVPATRIVEVAEQTDARMIVMGSRGHTGLEHLLLGSTAERVIQLSAIPVTIVKAKPGTASED